MPTMTTIDQGQLQQLLTDAIKEADRRHGRSQQLRPGISQLGGCARQAGYGHHGTEPTDTPEGGLQAQLGTWLHDGVLPVLRKQLRGRTWPQHRPPVLWRPAPDLPPIPGRPDLYVPRWRLLVDLKTVSTAALHAVRMGGPRGRHIMQVGVGYAEALELEDCPVDHIALLYLCRDTAEGHAVLLERSAARSDYAAQWWRDVVEADDPDQLDRGHRGPGVDKECDWCPWLRRCWGPDAKAGEATVQGIGGVPDPADNDGQPVEHDAVVSAMKLYADAGVRAGTAKADRDFAKSLLHGVRPGTYRGSDGTEWKLSVSRGKLSLDQGKVRADYEARGEEVPMTRGAPYISRVTKVGGEAVGGDQ